jgi:hypothetical protein
LPVNVQHLDGFVEVRLKGSDLSSAGEFKNAVRRLLRRYDAPQIELNAPTSVHG